MVHTLLATASQEGSLQDVVFALESILNVLHSRTTTTTTTTTTDTNETANDGGQIPEVLNANSLLSLLKNRYPNKHGELMKCVSILFFIPAIDSSGPTGAQHKRLVNAFVSTIDSPMNCAVQRGCAETVETYLALLVLSKIVLSSGTSSKRFFKTADYKGLTFLEWLGQVKFFGRSKKQKDDTYRALYGEWALHAGNDDTLHVLTHNEYTLRDLATLVCTSPFGRMILTRPNFFFQEKVGTTEEATLDYDEVFTTALITMSQPAHRVSGKSEPCHVDLLSGDAVGGDDDNISSTSSEECNHMTAEDCSEPRAPIEVKEERKTSIEVKMKNETPTAADPPVAGMFGDMPCPVVPETVNEGKRAFKESGAPSHVPSSQPMIDTPEVGTIPEQTEASTNPPQDHQHQTAALVVEEDYEDVGGASCIIEEEEDDFYLVSLEEYNNIIGNTGSMAMETEWEVLSS